MTPDTNKTLVRHFMERACNAGDLTIVDAALTPDGIDHQEPLGANFATHLKAGSPCCVALSPTCTSRSTICSQKEISSPFASL